MLAHHLSIPSMFWGPWPGSGRLDPPRTAGSDFESGRGMT